MSRRVLLFVAAVAVLTSCGPAPDLSAQADAARGTGGEGGDPITNAERAAPAALSRHATVVDHHGAVLREGTNGWVCMPDDPAVPNDSPMCLDEPWREFVDALIARRTPSVQRLGIGYMLQGDMPVSNTDPFATGPTADNEWVEDSGPHIMLIVPDARMLSGLPTDPRNGGPWVMWHGTPYAHVMLPAPQRVD